MSPGARGPMCSREDKGVTVQRDRRKTHLIAAAPIIMHLWVAPQVSSFCPLGEKEAKGRGDREHLLVGETQSLL